MERLQGSHSVLGWNDSRGVTLSWDGTTPGEFFCPGDGTTPGESFCPGDGTTPEESFCLYMELLQGSPSVLG